MRDGEVEYPKGLLYKLAEYRAKDAYQTFKRKRQHEWPVGLIINGDWPPEDDELPQSVHWSAQREEFTEDFDSAVRDLPGETRDAFILTELRGLTAREAAPLLGASHMTIHRRAEAARRTVREEIR